MSTVEETVANLQKNWVWIPDWKDENPDSAAGVVTFTRRFECNSGSSPSNGSGDDIDQPDTTLDIDSPFHATLHFTADTRYKLWVNGSRVAVGPTRSCAKLWYYDSLNIAPWLRPGENVVSFDVLRFFPRNQAGVPFARTNFPGLTVHGSVRSTNGEEIDLSTSTSSGGWTCRVQQVKFPIGRDDDYFLHVFERATAPTSLEDTPTSTPRAYNFNTGTGQCTPWNLVPRLTPFPEEAPCGIQSVVQADSTIPIPQWDAFFQGCRHPVVLPANSRHCLDVQATEHSTAFISFVFGVPLSVGARVTVLYAESYEQEPTVYPWLRRKNDRLDQSGDLLGPYDVVTFDRSALDAAHDSLITYEPFWFRTFRFMRVTIETGESDLRLESFSARQVNYPLNQVARWRDDVSPDSNRIWDVSVRTLRNCMFDGYSDCPYYEQLQYAEDTRSSGLFHYLLSGDDRLMRQAIIGFATSMLPEGLAQCRYPSHVPQVIPGFALFWVLQVCDHHLYFNDAGFTRRFLPQIMQVLDFFESHVDHRGLVSGLSSKYWQFVDWATPWSGSESHPNGGVPVQGRASNTYTYISMLYAFVAATAATMARQMGRAGLTKDFEERSARVRAAINEHCFDGSFYLDSTTDQAPVGYSQHSQVFAVLCGAATGDVAERILLDSFGLSDPPRTKLPSFAQCSYVMTHYAFRAFSQASRELYASFWKPAWRPWLGMLDKNLSTWEEDTVTQRSDCHAWGSVAIYEYLVEVAGIHPSSPGWAAVMFEPRLELSPSIEAVVAMGRDNAAHVSWHTTGTEVHIHVRFNRGVALISVLPGGEEVEHGIVEKVEFVHAV